ncbi:kinesin-like protein KIN-UA [Typha latifolia]|uniref:kinesin-like protein KIN-UA n=1 Tax=Typha latifolia TaxID=4733 RepID=UPI003C2F6EEC
MASNASGRASLRSERQIPTGRVGNGSASVRTKSVPPKRSATASSLRSPVDPDNADPGRVRVAVRLRPRNADDFPHDSDFTSCVELQPEFKRLKLRKNNWSSESYRFDEVFTERSSQLRVYEAVAKPVVESVLAGYNGTVMAYGQTGTGKTYTVGRLGKDDPSERGIMVRALEDILASTSAVSDIVEVSYLQLYLESVQDLLAPEKNNIPIAEDPKTGEVSLPGAAVVELRDLDHFLELLQTGEANRHASNTKLNTESSRSHAILAVHIQRSLKGKEEKDSSSLANSSDNFSSRRVPLLLKSKLLIVDLAGSERINKSGSEGHMLEEAKFINLSLTSLGKCINALAENSPHIPTRDSKLTRLLRDSFGGSARTSLIITIGPSAKYYSETSSTIMFGQRAMKIVNTVKLKEEVDYESLYRKVENQVDSLTSELERQQKLRDAEKVQMQKKLKEYEASFAEFEETFSMKSENLEKENNRLELEIRRLVEDLNNEKHQNDLMSKEIVHLKMSLNQSKEQQLENSMSQNILADTTQMYGKKIEELLKQLEDEQSHSASLEEQLNEMCQQLSDTQNSLQTQENVVDELKKELSEIHEESTSQIQSLKAKYNELFSEKELLYEELKSMEEKVLNEARQRKSLEEEVLKLNKALCDNSVELESKGPYSMTRSASGLSGAVFMPRSVKSRETISGQKDTISKIFEEVGLSNILSMLKSEDLDVQIHAVKVVANLAAEDINQERIVEEGGLDALLLLLEASENTTIHRVTAGAIANLAMNGSNQGLIMNKGGARLLANIASKTNDPQTLRMVAGAIANLCGNEKLHVTLKKDGGIKALLGMIRGGHSDVIAQISRGVANFAKCESRSISQGFRKGRSLLIEDGALNWMVANSTTFSASTSRHIELAFCHLAQNEDNAGDIISSGGIKELVRISQESSREDIRNLAKKALNSNPVLLAAAR